MFLKAGLQRLRPWTFTFLTGLGLVQGAQAQSDWHLQSSLQMGLDAWRIEHSATDKTTQGTMYLADSDTRWTFSEWSPWYSLQSQLNLGASSQVVLRGRANQGLGSSLDQLYLDHAISPSLGFRAGVADYRATWCREYDLDNPWVRESDPFCSHRVVRLSSSSAPALQAYVNLELGNYQMQGAAGIYRPRAFGYAKREFGDFRVKNNHHITKNHKQAVSLNIVDKSSSTEWRLSWIGLDQSLFDSDFVQFNDKSIYPSTQLDYHQKSNTFFAGVSWQVSPKLRSRLTHMTSDLKAHCVMLNPLAGPPSQCSNRYKKASTVLELNYQLFPTDILSVSFVTFPVIQDTAYKRDHQSMSAAWRHDWGKGWFNALQLSRAQSETAYNLRPLYVPYVPGLAKAWAAGFRLGYQW